MATIEDLKQKHESAKRQAAAVLKSHIELDALYHRSRPVIDRIRENVALKLRNGERPSEEDLWIAFHAEQVLIDRLRTTGNEFDPLADEVDRLLQERNRLA